MLIIQLEVFAQTRIYSRRWDSWKYPEFWDKNGFLNPGQSCINKEKVVAIKWILLFTKEAEWKWKKKKRQKYPGSCRRVEGSGEHDGDGDTNRSWNPLNTLQRAGKDAEVTEERRNNREYQDYSTFKTS